MPPRRYIGLQIGKAGMLFALEGPRRSARGAAGMTVHRYDLKTRKATWRSPA